MHERGPGHGDPIVGLGLREVEDLSAVVEHRRAGEPRVEVALLHLRDVGDERRLGATGLSQQLGEPRQELVVGDRLERPLYEHATDRTTGSGQNGSAPNGR